jgi:DNA polymerase-1
VKGPGKPGPFITAEVYMSVDWNIDVPLPEYVGNDEQARELLRLCMRKVELDPEDYIGFDTETHGRKVPIKQKPLDWFTDTVTYWSIAFDLTDQGPRRYCIPQEYFTYFTPLLENPDAMFAGWNGKYDAHISWNMGVNIWNCRRFVDGLALANLHDENRRSNGLKACAADYVGLNMTPYKTLFDGIKDAGGKKAKEFETSLVELVELGHIDKVSDYASYDAYAHLRSVQWLIERLKETPLGPDSNLWAYFLEMEIYFTEMLWRMERRGMHLDLPYMRSKIPVLKKRIDALERDICRIAGRPINIQSPKQLAAYFFLDEEGLKLDPVKLTKTHQPSTDEEVMDALAEAGVDVATKVVEARKLNKTKSTYIEALISLAEYFPDGRIHPSFNQFGARTGRLSTQNPNSQNFPRPDNDEWGIRSAFIPRPGYKLIVADYAQIEMRIMADMANDQKMLGAIREGKDLHCFTVSQMVPGVTYEEAVAAKKAEKPDDRQKWLLGKRQDMKAVGFGIIYGAGPPKISTSIEISDADWHAKIDEMDERTFQRRVTRVMKRNPLLTEEQAIEQVGRQSVAGEKIKEYFEVFPDVKGFMDQTPQMCRHTLRFDRYNKERDWNFQAFREGWGNIKELSESGHSKRFGYVQTLCGRYRRLEDIDHKNYFYRSEAERQAVNTRIQGSAADITKAAMLRIEHSHELNLLGVEVLNQVHDEIVMEVPEENAEIAAPIITQHMEHPFGDEEEALRVPIPVDLKIVDRWSDAK